MGRLWKRLAACALLVLCQLGEPASPPTSVIFLMLDTLRADHLGFYGYERHTSPNLDAFARDSLAFRWAFTAAPWTPPSVATMLTGLLPSSHGHTPPNSLQAAQTTRRLASQLETLPELLRRHGYRTAAVSPNPWISPLFGFDQGFERFEQLDRQPASEIVAAAISQIEDFSRRRDPFFLYLHFFDPHDPYTPPKPYAEMFPIAHTRPKHPYLDSVLRRMRAYDSEIRYLDDQLGRFFSFLKRAGLYDRALIVVTADHGEQFREHGLMRHGNALHNEELHVPLFIRDPGSAGRRSEVVEHVVSTADLFPTILGQLGIAIPADLEGVSLFAPAAVASRPGVVSEIRRVTDQRGFINQDKYKLILELPQPLPDEGRRLELWQQPQLVGLFDMRSDYFEQKALDDRDRLGSLKAELVAAFQKAPRVSAEAATIPASEMRPEVIEQLRALGYLNEP